MPTLLSPTLPLQIAERLGAAIIEETFEPGERLKEAELASVFGVSRATLREALRILETRGLVKILPQRGAQVTQLSPRELEDLFEIRAEMLGLSGRRAAARCTPEDQRLLRITLVRLSQAVDDTDTYARLSAGAVMELLRIADNEALTSFITDFGQRMGRYARLGLTTRARRRQSLANWRGLIDAVCSHREEEAARRHRQLALDNRDAALAEVKRRAPQENG